MTELRMSDGWVQGMLRRRGVRQFVKFCIVGASSTVIDVGVYLLLMEALHLPQYVGQLVVARSIAKTLSFLLAVTNGFVWNSRWTFARPEAEGRQARYAKFVATNVVGLLINLVILNSVAHVFQAAPALIPGFLSHLHDPAGLIGMLVGIVVVVFWNFTASKYWTFKH
jgi:putative flippase GtrA